MMKKWLLGSLCILSISCVISYIKQPHVFPYAVEKTSASTALKEDTLENLPHFEGWCSPHKASLMMDLILAIKPRVCVEIGVFGGSSAYPTLQALKYNKDYENQEGVLYAIDPWKNEEAVKNYESSDEHAIWWGNINLHNIFSGFIKNLKNYRLEEFCIIMQKTSEQAASEIPSHIDILHIDGNHTEKASILDIELYLPKVRQGGFIWFDDFESDKHFTTKKAGNLLRKHCKLVYQYKDGEVAFALFKKN